MSHRVFVRIQLGEVPVISLFNKPGGSCFARRALDDWTASFQAKINDVIAGFTDLKGRSVSSNIIVNDNDFRVEHVDDVDVRSAVANLCEHVDTVPLTPESAADPNAIVVDETGAVSTPESRAQAFAAGNEALALARSLGPITPRLELVPEAEPATGAYVTTGVPIPRTAYLDPNASILGPSVPVPAVAPDAVVQLGDLPEGLTPPPPPPTPESRIKLEVCPSCGGKPVKIEHGFIMCNVDPKAPDEEAGCGWAEPVAEMEKALADTNSVINADGSITLTKLVDIPVRNLVNVTANGKVIATIDVDALRASSAHDIDTPTAPVSAVRDHIEGGLDTSAEDDTPSEPVGWVPSSHREAVLGPARDVGAVHCACGHDLDHDHNASGTCSFGCLDCDPHAKDPVKLPPHTVEELTAYVRTLPTTLNVEMARDIIALSFMDNGLWLRVDVDAGKVFAKVSPTTSPWLPLRALRDSDVRSKESQRPSGYHATIMQFTTQAERDDLAAAFGDFVLTDLKIRGLHRDDDGNYLIPPQPPDADHVFGDRRVSKNETDNQLAQLAKHGIPFVPPVDSSKPTG